MKKTGTFSNTFIWIIHYRPAVQTDSSWQSLPLPLHVASHLIAWPWNFIKPHWWFHWREVVFYVHLLLVEAVLRSPVIPLALDCSEGHWIKSLHSALAHSWTCSLQGRSAQSNSLTGNRRGSLVAIPCCGMSTCGMFSSSGVFGKPSLQLKRSL